MKLSATIFLWSAAIILSACAGRQPSEADVRDETLNIAELVSNACQTAVRAGPISRDCPPYLEMLIADGRISIGLGVGTADLGRVQLPEDKRQWQSSQTCRVFGRDVIIDSRLILTNEDFRAALETCEVIFVASHSRFGAGPVFLHGGKDKPFRMQGTPGYEIIMPYSEVSGYQGTVLRTYHDSVKNKDYTIFAPDSRDLDGSVPLRAYQVLVLATCSSLRHFLDEVQAFRQGYPTTAIFASQPSLVDLDMRVFKRLLYELFRGAPAQDIVFGLNEEYRAAAWVEIKRGRPPWKIVDNLFSLGINTVAP
jgi:hypothetical protein